MSFDKRSRSPVLLTTRASKPLFRRRRVLFTLTAILCTVFYFFSGVITTSNNGYSIKYREGKKVSEIYGLLHFVTNKKAPSFIQPIEVGPGQVPDMRLYDDEVKDWSKQAFDMDKVSPLIVFSKTYCPHSRRTKQLYESYQLSPPPLIIEVDTREDGEIVKHLLGRLTKRATFPNSILLGKSIGGNDDVLAADARGQLRPMLEAAGIKVGNPKAGLGEVHIQI